MRDTVQVHEHDNVVIAVRTLKKGTILGEGPAEGILLLQDIPQGHKISCMDIPLGKPVIRYGVVLGYATEDIVCGQWVHEQNIHLGEIPSLENFSYGHAVVMELPVSPRTTFEGYYNGPNVPAGTRNILGITTTVQCVAGILNVAVERIKKDLLPLYPHVDGVVALNHAYGCGVAINAPDAYIPIRSIQNLAHNPNFGNELMVIGLGCEKLTVERLLKTSDNSKDNVIVLQDFQGFDAIMEAIVQMARKKLEILNRRVRQTLPLSFLRIGMQCGGSDAFSGISANPAAGKASDLLVGAGATVLFSEVTEVRDGVQFLFERCQDHETAQKLAEEMQWYDDYLAKGGVGRDANPTPGNKKGGLSNIIEKAMGSIAKSGKAPIAEVVGCGEWPRKTGLIFAATPASDIVCGPMQVASGITLQVFMTGRGTPYGLAPVPVIKVSSRSDLKIMWPDLIDVDAGPVITGEASLDEIGFQLFNEILDVASGRKTYAEQYGLYNDLCVFNPAPIT